MPKISSKGLNMPQSPIRKLAPFADRAIEEGKKIYFLNIGQPDISTPKAALDAVKNIILIFYLTAPHQDLILIKKSLAKYYVENSIDIDADDLIVTTGGSEALLFTMGSITDPGDEVIIPEPFYANYSGFAVASGVIVKPVVSNFEDNFALPPISEFEKQITEKPKL